MAPDERHIRVHRTARFYMLGAPAGETTELWIACHGYGQLAAGFAKALEPLASDQRVVVVPEALNRFYLDEPMKYHGPSSQVGASWMTREDRERDIADNIDYLDTLAATVRDEIPAKTISVVALGFSQGVATAARWAALGNVEIRHLILWAGTVPPDLPGERGDRLFRGASLTLVAGRRDEVVTPAAAEKARTALREQGIAARVELFDGGHALNGELLRRLSAEISSAA